MARLQVVVAMLLLAVAAALPASVLGCVTNGISITKVSAAAKPADSSAYKLEDVHSHFMNLGDIGMALNANTSYSCVDARGDDKYLSTPGGDYAELSDAIYVFFEQTKLTPNASSIEHIFASFMDEIATPTRPFYFHTDEAKLNELFKAAGAAGIKPKPVVFPTIQPKDAKEAKIWYDLIAKPEYQGCGHVRLMLYKYKEYGLTSSFIPEELIKAFFKYWWPTPLGSPQRKKVDFSIKRGPLAGKAVAIVTNDGPACPEKTPLAVTAHGGSSIFIYHQAAVAEFRTKVLAPLMAKLAKTNYFTGKPVPFDEAAFVKRMNALAGEQLAYTINNLYPADSVNLYSVKYKTIPKSQAPAGNSAGQASGINTEKGTPLRH